MKIKVKEMKIGILYVKGALPLFEDNGIREYRTRYPG